MSKNKKIDTYISQSQDFAKPILNHLRELIHLACPQIEESIKWGHPHFEYKGLLCNMAAFNKHCAFGFWKAPLMKDAGLLKENNDDAMGHSGKLKSLLDLPTDKIIIARIHEATLLNEQGVHLPAKKHLEKTPEIKLPLLFKNELQKNKEVFEKFNSFSPSQKKEYIEWIEDAKKEETKLKRIASTIKWVMEDKTRN